LRDADKCKAEDIVTNFQPRSFTLTLRNINSTNYTLEVKTLLNNIDPSGSYVKCKSDIVSIFLKKQETGKSWSVLTEKEAIVKDKPMPKMDENADPQEGLMSMMKKMYEEGDDEMKRTITKAFAESREKSLRGEGLNMDI
jgi:calcyclin binding protein